MEQEPFHMALALCFAMPCFFTISFLLAVSHSPWPFFILRVIIMYKSTVSCLMLLCIGVSGCSDGGGGKKLATNKVTGKVIMNGAPVPGVSVSFSPIETGKPPAMGISDTQGIYILTTYDSGDGAVEGDYKVMVYKGAPSAAPAAPTHDPTGQSSGGGAPKHSGPASKGQTAAGGSLLPEKYSSASTTTISKSVKSGENTIDIEL